LLRGLGVLLEHFLEVVDTVRERANPRRVPLGVSSELCDGIEDPCREIASGFVLL